MGSGRSLTQSDEICEWRDRRDSNPKLDNAQYQSEKGIPPLRPEALTQILTHFSGKDRQMLTQIVKRWGQSQRRVEEGGFEGGGVGEPLTGG